MPRKNIGKTLLFPHIAVLLILPPCAIGAMLWAMRTLSETHPLTIAFYVLSFYALLLWCVRIPNARRFFRSFRERNPYLKRWCSDVRLRTNVLLCAGVVCNGAYAALQFALGIAHKSAWFYSLAAYYACLAAMRLSLVRHTLRHKPGEKMHRELLRYRACGWVFLLMNLALSGMIFYMVRENRATRHHEITTIALAAYGFAALTAAIVNVIRYRKYHSPAISAAKAISLTSACVSMLSLENTMLQTFAGGEMPAQTRRLFLTLSGGAISVFVVMTAIYMIVQSNQKIKQSGESNNG